MAARGRPDGDLSRLSSMAHLSWPHSFTSCYVNKGVIMAKLCQERDDERARVFETYSYVCTPYSVRYIEYNTYLNNTKG